MKATEDFKNVITQHIALRAIRDDKFAESLGKEDKNMDDCITYILNRVKDSGCNAFTDAEIYGMAVHYFDEDNIEVGQPVNCQVIHAPEAETEQTDEPETDEPETDEPESKSQLSLF